MDNGPRPETWGAYIKRLTDREGWSAARLARDIGRNESTIWAWIKAVSGRRLTVDSVMAVATATGEDPLDVFKAAAGLDTNVPSDPEIAEVRALNLHPRITERIIETILERRERDRAARMADTQRMARFAEEQTPT